MNKTIVKKILILVGSIIATIAALKVAVFYMPFLIAFALYLLIEPAIKFFMKKFKLKRKTSSLLILTIAISVIVRFDWMGNSDNYFGSFKSLKKSQ